MRIHRWTFIISACSVVALAAPANASTDETTAQSYLGKNSPMVIIAERSHPKTVGKVREDTAAHETEKSAPKENSRESADKVSKTSSKKNLETQKVLQPQQQMQEVVDKASRTKVALDKTIQEQIVLDKKVQEAKALLNKNNQQLHRFVDELKQTQSTLKDLNQQPLSDNKKILLNEAFEKNKQQQSTMSEYKKLQMDINKINQQSQSQAQDIQKKLQAAFDENHTQQQSLFTKFKQLNLENNKLSQQPSKSNLEKFKNHGMELNALNNLAQVLTNSLSQIMQAQISANQTNAQLTLQQVTASVQTIQWELASAVQAEQMDTMQVMTSAEQTVETSVLAIQQELQNIDQLIETIHQTALNAN